MAVVLDYLTDRNIAFDLLEHPPVSRAVDRAEKLGVDPSRVVKAVLVKVASGFVLAILPASKKITMRSMRLAADYPQAVLATEEEVSEQFKWCDLGALPAMPDLLQVPSYVDISVRDHIDGILAAGSRTQSIMLNMPNLLKEGSVIDADLT